MDMLLIFVSVVQLTCFFRPRLNQLFEAGLFSAINSAFIVNMESDLSPNPSDATNALLKILVNKVDNDTFSDHDAFLPIWNPSSTIIWIQTGVHEPFYQSSRCVWCSSWETVVNPL